MRPTTRPAAAVLAAALILAPASACPRPAAPRVSPAARLVAAVRVRLAEAARGPRRVPKYGG